MSDIIAEVLPDAKVAAIAALQREGRIVAMAGDGIKDAAASAQAQIGIATGISLHRLIGGNRRKRFKLGEVSRRV